MLIIVLSTIYVTSVTPDLRENYMGIYPQGVNNMIFVILYQSGAVLATTLEVHLNEEDEFVLYATDSSTGNITIIKYLGSDEKEAEQIVSTIHEKIIERFTCYTVDTYNKPILFDFR